MSCHWIQSQNDPKHCDAKAAAGKSNCTLRTLQDLGSQALRPGPSWGSCRPRSHLTSPGVLGCSPAQPAWLLNWALSCGMLSYLDASETALLEATFACR
jgi:hypothetical protein